MQWRTISLPEPIRTLWRRRIVTMSSATSRAPALDEIERALALADPAAAREQQPDPVDVDEGSVHRRRRSKGLVEEVRQFVDQRGRVHGGSEDRDGALVAHLPKLVGRREPLGHDDAGNRELQDVFDRPASVGLREGFQVGDLGLAEDQDPLEEEILREPREGETRPIDVAHGDVLPALEPLAEEGQMEQLPGALEELADRNAGHRRPSTPTRRARSSRRPGGGRD